MKGGRVADAAAPARGSSWVIPRPWYPRGPGIPAVSGDTAPGSWIRLGCSTVTSQPRCQQAGGRLANRDPPVASAGWFHPPGNEPAGDRLTRTGTRCCDQRCAHAPRAHLRYAHRLARAGWPDELVSSFHRRDMYSAGPRPCGGKHRPLSGGGRWARPAGLPQPRSDRGSRSRSPSLARMSAYATGCATVGWGSSPARWRSPWSQALGDQAHDPRASRDGGGVSVVGAGAHRPGIGAWHPEPGRDRRRGQARRARRSSWCLRAWIEEASHGVCWPAEPGVPRRTGPRARDWPLAGQLEHLLDRWAGCRGVPSDSWSCRARQRRAGGPLGRRWR